MLPQALFGVLNQTMPAGGPPPASFLTTQNSFTTGIANPANFNPLVSNVDYIPANSPVALHPELVPVGAAAAH